MSSVSEQEGNEMDLASCRERIDAIDGQLVSLFLERMAVSRAVAAAKAGSGQPVYVPERERAVLARVSEAAGPEEASGVRMLYGTIMDISRSAQYAQVFGGRMASFRKWLAGAVAETPQDCPAMPAVAACGADGSYVFQAAEKAFPHATLHGFRSIPAVFQAVSAGLCRYGVIPIENSTSGLIRPNIALLAERACYIVRTVTLRLRHALLACPGVRTEDIREIWTHEQAAAQCGNFLASPGDVRVISGESTAVFAKRLASSGCRDTGVIASPQCASLYGLSVLRESVQDDAEACTRFACFARTPELYPDAQRIGIRLQVPDRPGELARLAGWFAASDMQIATFSCGPAGMGEVTMPVTVEFSGSVRQPAVAELLAGLSVSAEAFEFLGNYSVC